MPVHSTEARARKAWPEADIRELAGMRRFLIFTFLFRRWRWAVFTVPEGFFLSEEDPVAERGGVFQSGGGGVRRRRPLSDTPHFGAKRQFRQPESLQSN
jgi:hypothetical protein